MVLESLMLVRGEDRFERYPPVPSCLGFWAVVLGFRQNIYPRHEIRYRLRYNVLIKVKNILCGVVVLAPKFLTGGTGPASGPPKEPGGTCFLPAPFQLLPARPTAPSRLEEVEGLQVRR